MIRKSLAWKAKVYHGNGDRREFFPEPTRRYSSFDPPYLPSKLYPGIDANRIVQKQAGTGVINVEVWPVPIEYNTKTRELKEAAPPARKTGNLTDYQSGKTNVERGRLFEDYLEQRLTKIFATVRRNIWILGKSGQVWQADFLADDFLVIEASTEKRSEIKVNTTFLKFIDLKQNFERYKFALVFAASYKKVYGKAGMQKERYVVVLQPHKAFLAQNFAILLESDIERLVQFYRGDMDAIQL